MIPARTFVPLARARLRPFALIILGATHAHKRARGGPAGSFCLGVRVLEVREWLSLYFEMLPTIGVYTVAVCCLRAVVK